MFKIIWNRLVEKGQILHVASATFPKKDSTGMHSHDFFEFFIVLEGSGTHKVNAGVQNIKTNDLVLIRPQDSHMISGHLCILNVAFSKTTLSFLLKRYYPENANMWGENFALPKVLPLSLMQRQMLTNNLLSMRQNLFSQLESDRLLLNLLNELENISGENIDKCPEWLANACKNIRLPENISKGVSGFFQLAGRSPEHVARVLKKTTGFTPTEIVLRAKMEYAASQLRLTGRTILEISMDCGYKSLSRFYLVFGNYFKTSPRQYRLKNQSVY